MIEELSKHLKRNLAQHTRLFDTVTQEITLTLKNDVISTADISDGTYALSGAIDSGHYSSGVINDVYTFVQGKVTVDAHLGNTATQIKVTASKLNVGYMFNHERAQEAADKTKENLALVYYSQLRSSPTQPEKIEGESQPKMFDVRYTIGALFVVKISEMYMINCVDYDKIYINALVNAKVSDTTLLRFVSLIERSFLSNKYIVDMEFELERDMYVDSEYAKNIQSFEAKIQGVEITQGE